jgi:hypothetical protein
VADGNAIVTGLMLFGLSSHHDVRMWAAAPRVLSICAVDALILIQLVLLARISRFGHLF